MLTGENGILTQAKNAKEETENATRKEEEDLAKLEAMVNGEDIVITPVDDENPGQLEQEDETTFVINSIEDLVFFSYDVTTNGNKYENQTVKLGTNLDFSSDKSYVNPNRTDFAQYGYTGKLKELLITGTGFSPIGEQATAGENYFYGVFDGDNNAICSLYINIDSSEDVRGGLFSINYGEIRNLGLVNTNIVIQGATTNVGGIAGDNYNDIYNSYVTGNINVTANHWMGVGGICGTMIEADIENCYNLANIEGKNIKEDKGNASVVCGGIIGQGCPNINKCFNQGEITANSGINDTYVGGICGNYYLGDSRKIIKNSYNKAKIEGECSGPSSVIAGGIVGNFGQQSNMSIENCYNYGEIVANTKQGRTGGIIGQMQNNSKIDNVFNGGKIILENGKYEDGSSGVGGILGVVFNEANNTEINYAYNIGAIELKNTTNQRIGSIMGNRKTNVTITLSNCYYLIGTYDVSVGYGDDTGITAIDSIEDFPSVLDVVNGENAFKADTNNINNGYPILEWQ